MYENFRPISNLSFISKATKKVVVERMSCYLGNANLHEIFHSKYKKGHSTETALTRIHNDIFLAIDDECVILLFLDLSVAFDTVDHGTLIDRLRHRFGIPGKALAWIESYLTDRTQFLKIGSGRSSNQKLSKNICVRAEQL